MQRYINFLIALICCCYSVGGLACTVYLKSYSNELPPNLRDTDAGKRAKEKDQALRSEYFNFAKKLADSADAIFVGQVTLLTQRDKYRLSGDSIVELYAQVNVEYGWKQVRTHNTKVNYRNDFNTCERAYQLQQGGTYLFYTKDNWVIEALLLENYPHQSFEKLSFSEYVDYLGKPDYKFINGRFKPSLKPNQNDE